MGLHDKGGGERIKVGSAVNEVEDVIVKLTDVKRYFG